MLGQSLPTGHVKFSTDVLLEPCGKDKSWLQPVWHSWVGSRCAFSSWRWEVSWVWRQQGQKETRVRGFQERKCRAFAPTTGTQTHPGVLQRVQSSRPWSQERHNVPVGAGRDRGTSRGAVTRASGDDGSPLPLPGCWCRCPHWGLQSCRPPAAGAPWSPGTAATPETTRTCLWGPEGGCQGSSWAGFMQGLCEGLPPRDGPSTAVMSGVHPPPHGPPAAMVPSSPCGSQPWCHHWLPIALVFITLDSFSMR